MSLQAALQDGNCMGWVKTPIKKKRHESQTIWSPTREWSEVVTRRDTKIHLLIFYCQTVICSLSPMHPILFQLQLSQFLDSSSHKSGKTCGFENRVPPNFNPTTSWQTCVFSIFFVVTHHEVGQLKVVPWPWQGKWRSLNIPKNIFSSPRHQDPQLRGSGALRHIGVAGGRCEAVAHRSGGAQQGLTGASIDAWGTWPWGHSMPWGHGDMAMDPMGAPKVSPKIGRFWRRNPMLKRGTPILRNPMMTWQRISPGLQNPRLPGTWVRKGKSGLK